MLEARDVTYKVQGTILVDSVSLAIKPGRIAALIGPNGAGKSTLLRILAGELRATSGKVLLDSRDLQSCSAALLASRRSVVPQASSLAFPFTVLEVAMLGVSVPGFEIGRERATTIARDALQTVGLHDLASRPYPHLSGGERQRVHIARALCQLMASTGSRDETRCFLLDEPTSNLDLAHQASVLTSIRAQARLGTAVVTVFHDLNLAAALADDIVLLEGGQIKAVGAPANILKDDLLSAAYGCKVLTNRTPSDGRPFVLPPAVFSMLDIVRRPAK